MQAQQFMRQHNRYSRSLALLLTLLLGLGLIQPAQAQAVTPGYVQGWGLDQLGQLPVPSDLSDVIAVAASQVHSLALKSNGEVVAWGSNIDGQTDVPASAMSGVIAIAAGGDHSMALKSDGTVVAWGSNANNQLDIPPGLNNVIAIAAGDFHSLALKSNGEVVAWGCGGGYDYDQCTVPASALSGVTAIGAGAAHSLALKGGGVIAWGIDLQGQIAVPASATSGVVAIAAAGGSNHSLALKSNGAIVAWGRNTDGQTDVPAGLSGVVAIATGFNHSLALKSDGTLAAWGNNAYGQTDVPAGLTGIVGMAGGWHTLVIVPPPSVTINQAAGQADPTTTTPILFTVTFNKPVTDFNAADVSLSGTAGLANATITISGGPSVYTINVDGVAGGGTVIATIPANGAIDANGYGNRASTSSDNSVTLTVVSNPPTITPNVVGTLGNNGWYVSNVTLSWTVAANGAAISSQSGCETQTITSDTSGVTFTCSATNAGGSSSQSITIKRDATAPTISAAATSNPNPNSWYNSNVTVRFTCSDALAGVTSCPADQILSNEGATVAANAPTITDLAGNSSAPSNVVTVKIDKTAPTISAAATTPPNANGWYQNDVTVGFTCADSLAGVTSCPAVQVLSSEGVAVAATAQSVTDLAGNSSTPSNVVTVKIDKTAPTISAAATTPPNAAGWYNSNVTVRFTCSDALAGVTSCPADQILSNEGSAIASTAQTITDRAGNTSAASNVVTVQLDKTAPVVAVTGATSGAIYPTGNPPTVDCTTSDALAGVATQATLAIRGGLLGANGAGRFIATCSGATDNAGNGGIGSTLYTIGVLAGRVIGWGGNTLGQITIPAGLRDVIAVAGGGNHTLALKRDGTVVAWGSNSDGQSTVPVGLSDVIAIAAGQLHSLALKRDGTVVAWGRNDVGQISVPTGLNNVVAIASAGFFSLALKGDGTVVAWGQNTQSTNKVPAGLNNVVAIAGGVFQGMALKSDGTVVTWADSSSPQPTPPAGLNNVVAIAGGRLHSLALKGDGTVVAWGSNNFSGQLNIPAGLNNVFAIIAGLDHNVALKGDGTVVAWGSNNFSGQLNVPPGLRGVLGIGAGNGNGLAIVTAPSVTVEQAADQTDPTGSQPVRFAVVFSEAVTGFTAEDVTISGTANLAGATVTVSGGPSSYIVSVAGLAGTGTVNATVADGVATNADGNLNFASTSTDNTVTFNADSTGPVITPNVAGTLGNNGWYTSDVNVTWNVVDNESAISSQTGCEAQSVTSDTGGVTFTCTATSAGGSSSQSVTIKRDATAPTITFVDRTAANPNGWNNSAVTVNWSCSDATSGVVAANASQTVSGEGANQSVTGACTDKAGNSASDTQNGIKIDKTAPVVTVTGVSNGASYPLGSVPTAGCSTTDGLSGVATQATLSVTGGNPDGTGSFTATCSGASDNAGNSAAPVSAIYSVAYNWTGFFQPVDNLPVVNTVNAGQAIPVKFSLGGNYGLNIFASGYPASQQVSCGGSGGSSTSPIEETVTAGNSSLQYDPGTQRYIYVWKTDKAWAGTCRQLIVKLIDGTEHIALFQFNGKGRSAGESDTGSDEAMASRVFLPLVNQ